jgi:hypothetical protein
MIVYEGIVCPISVLPDTTVSPFQVAHLAFPWAKFTEHILVFELLVIPGLYEIQWYVSIGQGAGSVTCTITLEWPRHR